MRWSIVFVVIVLSGFASSSFAADNPACIEAYKTEIARIGRDAERAAAANPPGRDVQAQQLRQAVAGHGGDVQAQQQFMIPIHEAMKAAADRAEQCEKKSRVAKPAPAAANVAQRERECMETAENKLTALHQRYGRSPSAAEQAAMRGEEGRIGDARMACLRLAR